MSGCFFQKIPTLQYTWFQASAHVRRAPLKDSTIYYFDVFTALKSINLSFSLNLSLSLLPFFLSYCSSCLSSSRCKDRFWPTWCCLSPHPGVTGLFSPSSATQQRLLFLHQSFHPCKDSMSISVSLLPLKDISQHVSTLNILQRVTVAGCKTADIDGCHSHFCEL